MGSNIPKVLHNLNGKPLVFWTLDLLKRLKVGKTVVVIGYRGDVVKNSIIKRGYKTTFVKQRKPLGTANAVKIGLTKIPKRAKNVLIIYGDDSSLYKVKTIRGMINYHIKKNFNMTILTLRHVFPIPVGGIERNSQGDVIDVQSQKEIKDKNLRKTEILCGVFCFNYKWLEKNIRRIKKGHLRGEYPLPVLIKMAADEGNFCGVYSLSNPNEWCSINTLSELRDAEIKMRKIRY